MKTEKWVEIRLWFSRFDLTCYKRLLLSFIKPVIKELKNKQALKTFHFFFEPEPHLLFRIELCTEDAASEIKKLVRNYRKSIEDFIDSSRENELFADYPGEAEDFGEDGWEIAKKVFECGSEMAIGKLDLDFRKGKKLQVGKLLHCLLNSLGYSFSDYEAIYHLRAFVSRMLILERKETLDEALEAKIRAMLEEQLTGMRGRKIELI
jgi:hypothetical protein